ncbi:MAG: transcriptional regulator [Desulfotalea sp.]|nr:MAG: transcriptional regulator [Desulfotalea sp.]
MTKEEFSLARKKLAKTQKQLSELLGMSLKTIHSYEQGWRTIPTHIERHLYFLLINQRGRKDNLKPCWEQKTCNQKEKCPAWEFQSGHLCWFLSGTLCDCTHDTSHRTKLEICKQCTIFTNLLS